MIFATHLIDNREQFAILHNNRLYATQLVHPNLPSTIKGFLEDWDNYLALANTAMVDVINGSKVVTSIAYNEACLMAPVPQPTSCRDGYAFRQHVAAARRNRKV
jgi:fumarylacetoacetate (FAA) hydrolase